MENYHFRKKFMLQDLSTSHFSPNQRKFPNIPTGAERRCLSVLGDSFGGLLPHLFEAVLGQDEARHWEKIKKIALCDI